MRPQLTTVAWVATVAVLALLYLPMWAHALSTQSTWPSAGADYDIYQRAARRFLAGASFYEPYQLAGPYPIVLQSPVLYPPTVLPLLIAFTVLPAPLWWAIPVAATIAVIARHRPHPLAIAVMGLLAVDPGTVYALVCGNPGLWVMAAIAVATFRPWASPLVLVKFTLLPFALLGITKRSWWVSFAVIAGLSALFLPAWQEYLTALSNAQIDRGVFYSVGQMPMMLIPVVAVLGSRRRSGATVLSLAAPSAVSATGVWRRARAAFRPSIRPEDVESLGHA